MRGALSVQCGYWVAPAVLATVAMCLVVGTAANDFPTPANPLWGRAMPDPWATIDLVLIAVGAILFGMASAVIVPRHRLLAGLSAWFVSGCALFLVSIVIWRLHAPASAGNGL